MKIVCSAASCKYSSESEDSSNVIFISFPNNNTSAIWAENCGRQDLLTKSVQDLHTNQYICSDHIDKNFFISKTDPIIIASGAIPTIFEESRNTVVSMNRQKNEMSSNGIEDPGKLMDLDIIDDSRKINVDYRETIFNEKDNSIASNNLDYCDTSFYNFNGSSVDVTNLCRLCGHQSPEGTDIFTEQGTELRLREKISLHTPLSLEIEDSLPQKICLECCEKLEATHVFIVDCLQTDLRLRRFLNISRSSKYADKYADLVTACTIKISNDLNLEKNHNWKNSIDVREKAPINDCKWNTTSVELEKVEINRINGTSNENFKYTTDLNNLLEALEDTNVNDNEEKSRILPEEILKNSRLGCSRCRSVFETRETLENHEITCNSVLAKNPNGQIIRSTNESNDNQENREIFYKSANISSSRLCGYCLAEFSTRKELQIHINDCHDGKSLFKCRICDKIYEKWSSLDVHEATHRIDKPYLCDLCGKSFKHSNNLRGHKRIHLDDSKKKRHVCDACGNAFRSRFHLREHMNQHNGNKPYECDDCGKAFYKRIQLRQHRLSHGTNKHACPICGVTFNRRGNMNTHLKRHNKNEGMYTCSICEEKCKSMSELKIHRKRHTEIEIMNSIRTKGREKKLWQCKICEKIFSKRGILANHEATHTKDRARFECDICGKKLANKSSLNYHKKSLHSSERPHMCQYCGESFVSRESRLIHERIHTGERPYSCEICKMQYRCSSNLSQHMKVHLSVRPHNCQYCKKSFTRKGALVVHERIHTGFRPYICEICERSFSQKNDMIKHTRTHDAKFLNCEKCNENFATKNDILRHLNRHEATNFHDNERINEYSIVSQRSKYDSTNVRQETVELQIVQNQLNCQ